MDVFLYKKSVLVIPDELKQCIR